MLWSLSVGDSVRHPALKAGEHCPHVRVQKVGVSGVSGTMQRANITVLAASSQPRPAPCHFLGSESWLSH